MTKILAVDDEPDVTSLIAAALDHHRPGFVVSQCNFATDALPRIASEKPDVVLLDLRMPGRDGYSILEELRRNGNDVPVIVLTAKGLEQDKVRGLELGADDYVVKPFSTKELAARVEAVLRRGRSSPAAGAGRVVSLGDLVIDAGRREVQVAGRAISLTPTEFDLLNQLALHAGRVLEHRALLQRVWGPEYRDEVHYLKVYVARLRTKLEADPARPRYLHTVRGVGYRLSAPDDARA